MGACSAPGVGVAPSAATHTNSHVDTMFSMVTITIVVTGQGEGEPWLGWDKVVKAEDGV